MATGSAPSRRDAAAIGQSLRVNGVPMSIVGVLPPDFRFIDPEIQLLRAVAFTAEERADSTRHSNNWQQLGRLKTGATIDQVRAQLAALNAANDERFPALARGAEERRLRHAGRRVPRPSWWGTSAGR